MFINSRFGTSLLLPHIYQCTMNIEFLEMSIGDQIQIKYIRLLIVGEYPNIFIGENLNIHIR